MILLYFTFICLALGIHGIKLHEHMTKEEIEKTFECDHKLVHEIDYEVTPIHHVDGLDHRGQRIRRSNSVAYFKAFDKDISLYLLENDNTLLGSNTTVFMAQRRRPSMRSDKRPDIVYSRKSFPIPENLKLYHDAKNRAAVTVHTDEKNRAHMHGLVGDFIVKPVPARIHNEVLPKYQSSSSYGQVHNSWKESQLQDPLSGNFYQPTHHIVIKPKVQVNPGVYHSHTGDRMQKNNNGIRKLEDSWQQLYAAVSQGLFPGFPATTRPPKRTPNKPIENSDIVYPELLVSVDYETYGYHKHDIEELAKYMAAFWNAVDLRFRELSKPQVRLNIAGVIIPQTKDSAPYYAVAPGNDKAILFENTLTKIQEYFAKQDQISKKTYDIVVAMSRLQLASHLPNGTLDYKTSGIAYVSSACQVDSGKAAALIYDNGGFMGIITAAHELAHSMGARHDNDESKDNPLGPCRWSDGYIMSYQTSDSRGMHWSRCSKWSMREFFKSKEAQCLKNTPPKVGQPYPKILPGKLVDRDEQCTKQFGSGFVSDKDEQRNCAILHCEKTTYLNFVTTIKKITKFIPPAEGSSCGSGAICLDAQCVKDPKVT